MHPRVCFLVISSHGAEYEMMKTLWRLHARKGLRPGSDVWFLHGSTSSESSLPGCPDDITFPSISESMIPGILDKTVSAFERCGGFDVVVRTNLSSVYVFDRLYEYIDSFMDRGIDAAGCSEDQSHFSGCNMILSRKCVRYILDNKHMLDYTIIDDVALSQLLFANTKLIREWVPRLDFIDEVVLFHSHTPKMDDNASYHHIRLKSSDRCKDIMRMFNLLAGPPVLMNGDPLSP